MGDNNEEKEYGASNRDDFASKFSATLKPREGETAETDAPAVLSPSGETVRDDQVLNVKTTQDDLVGKIMSLSLTVSNAKQVVIEPYDSTGQPIPALKRTVSLHSHKQLKFV